LHEALLILHQEGLQNAYDRHANNHQLLRTGLENLGLEFVVDERCRLPQLNMVKIPDGVNDAAIRATLLNDFNLEIGAGLGDLAGKVWRIGLMGYASNPKNVDYCVNSLSVALRR
jgi:alanine-glyoxylate transaminase/serine-glyoxylate transaminase/serine-pyruvate transaminase